MTGQRRSRRVVYTVSAPAVNGWSTPQQVTVGRSGRISRVALRAPASSALGAAEVMVFQGDYRNASTGACTVTDPGADVPGEQRVVHITSISVTGSALTLDSDTVPTYAPVFDTSGTDTCWVSIKSATGGPQANVKLLVEYVDVE